MFEPDHYLTDILHCQPCSEDTLERVTRLHLLQGAPDDGAMARAVLLDAYGRIDTVVRYETPLDFLVVDIEPQHVT